MFSTCFNYYLISGFNGFDTFSDGFGTISDRFETVSDRFRIVFGSFRPGVWPDVRPGVRPDVRAVPVSSEVQRRKKKRRGVLGSPPAKPVKGGVWRGEGPPAQIRGVAAPQPKPKIFEIFRFCIKYYRKKVLDPLVRDFACEP